MTYDELKAALRKCGGYRQTIGKDGLRGFMMDRVAKEDRPRVEAMMAVAIECFFREITGETIPDDLTREIEDAETRA